MDRHQDAPDASFLLHEHEAIRRFVLKMVEAASAVPEPAEATSK